LQFYVTHELDALYFFQNEQKYLKYNRNYVLIEQFDQVPGKLFYKISVF